MRQLTLLIFLFITKIGLSQEKTPNIIFNDWRRYGSNTN